MGGGDDAGAGEGAGSGSGKKGGLGGWYSKIPGLP
jgi:hypothetical protein